MRADRLLSILMLLKSRERMTARELAQELEVSVRTIYRDMDVLSSAHFPIYSDKGKDGGYALLPDYDLNLSGFNERDIQALATLNIPEPFFEIGLGSGLKTALSKLLSLLSEDSQGIRDKQQNRFIFQPTRFDKSSAGNPGLTILQKAVWEDRYITCKLIYPIHFGLSDRLELAPFTLVAAQGEWYLICQRKDFFRVFPVKQLADIELSVKSFTRSRDYDANAHWNKWLAIQNQNTAHYPVVLEIQHGLLEFFSARYHYHHIFLDENDFNQEWRKIEVVFESLDQARMILLNLGSGVRVIEPEALRLSIIDYAKQAIIRNQ